MGSSRRGNRLPTLPAGLAAAAIALLGAAPGQSAAGTDHTLTPVVASTLAVPMPVNGSDGRVHMLYELLLTNASAFPATVERVDVLGSSDTPVASLTGAQLTARMRAFMFGGDGKPTNALDAGRVGFVGIALVFPTMAEVPAALAHRITVTLRGRLPAMLSARTTAIEARTRVDARPPVVLGPPLEGRWAFLWHFGAILPVDGLFYFSQRYALDAVGADRENRFLRPGGNLDNNASYVGYGKRLFAVADGTVVSVQNGLPDRAPRLLPSDTTLLNGTGNHVVLDIGNGRFVFSAHMKPGSVRVRLGDHVRRGDVIGLVGNSGNTTAAHLHIHVQDGPSPLASNGLPYVFDKFTVRGSADPEAVGRAVVTGRPAFWRTADSGPRSSVWPADGTLADMPSP